MHSRSRRAVSAGFVTVAFLSVASFGAPYASADPAPLGYDGCQGSKINVSGPGDQARVYCSKSKLGGSEFRAIAQCKSGNFVYGPWKPNVSTSQTTTCYSGVRGTFGQGYFYQVRN